MKPIEEKLLLKGVIVMFSAPVLTFVTLTICVFSNHVAYVFRADIPQLANPYQVAITAFLWATRLAVLASLLMFVVGFVIILIAGLDALLSKPKGDSK